MQMKIYKIQQNLYKFQNCEAIKQHESELGEEEKILFAIVL